MQIGKRLVIFMQGYDPRGLGEYYAMFRREFRRTCELCGLTGTVSDARDDPKRFTTAWNVTTNGAGWQVETQYVFLRWDDIINQDLARPIWWKIVQLYRSIGVASLTGATKRVIKADWRHALFWLAPLLLITVFIFLGTFFGLLCMNIIAAMHAPPVVAKIVGAVTGLGGFASLIRLSEPLTKLMQTCDEAATTDQIVNRKRKDIEARLDALTGALVDAIRKSDADEVIIAGHGLGAALAIDLAGRALIRDPELGGDGDRVRLLTLGANLPAIGFDPEAKWFRNRVRQLAVAPSIDWVDAQSRDDVMNVFPFDPVANLDIVLDADERRNPTRLVVNFNDLWKPGSSALRRLRPRKVHFQFLAANERTGAAYDYTLICCGPVDLTTRATRPAEAIAAIAAKPGQPAA